MNMCASIPAAAAYAAMALAALPAEGMATFRMPSSTHMETAQARPRALNEAVGLSPSSFTQSCSAPMRVPNLLVRTSGVQPSPTVTTSIKDKNVSVGGGHHRRVAPHVRRTAGHFAPWPAVPDDREIVPDQQRSSARAEVGHCQSIILGAAEAAFQMGRFRHSVEV